jgi:hypothetical protein
MGGLLRPVDQNYAIHQQPSRNQIHIQDPAIHQELTQIPPHIRNGRGIRRTEIDK